MDKRLKMVLYKDGRIISHPRNISHVEMMIFRGKMIQAPRSYSIIIRDMGVFKNVDMIPLHLIDDGTIKPNVMERFYWINRRIYDTNERISWVCVVCEQKKDDWWDIKPKDGPPEWFLRQYQWYGGLISAELVSLSNDSGGSIGFEWIPWKEFHDGRHKEVLG